MAIQVTCPHCHTRFNVSEKFAGKEGPCPKCKGKIKIPALSEQVVIHAPAEMGPKNAAGVSVLKPLKRNETVLSGVQITLIIASIVGFLAAAVVFRFWSGGDLSKSPEWLLGIASLVIAPPLIYVGYHLLRDQEMGVFSTGELRNRIAICAVVFAVLWGVFPLAAIAFDGYGLPASITAMIVMLGAGGAAAMYCMEFEYLNGLMHYGMYFLVCMVGRFIAGIGFLPQPSVKHSTLTTTWLEIEWETLQNGLESILACLV